MNRLPSTENLRLYNQFPRSYGNLRRMIEDLLRIASLGFNSVWLNPVHSVSRYEVRRMKQAVSGSLYAITDYRSVIDPKFGSEEELKEYAKSANALGLHPLFDLVLRHVGVGCHLVNERKNWFLKHDPEKPMNDVVDFIYAIPDDEEDKIRFNKNFDSLIYSTWQNEIFPFWQNYITKMMTLGFHGARIDAIRYLPVRIQKDIYEFIDNKCQEIHKRHAIIFAELLFGDKDDRAQMLKDMKAEFKEDSRLTHITNSLYYQPFNVSACNLREPLWKRRGDTLHILGELASVTKHGGTVGFGGSHDELPLALRALQDRFSEIEHRSYKKWEVISQVRLLENLEVRSDILRRMKRILTAMAFTSNGGWYLMCGDEFGHQVKKEVFTQYHEEFNNWHRPNSFFNISPFIQSLNSILKLLPPPQHGDWFEHIVLDQKPDLMVVVRHHGPAFEKTSLIIVNTGEKTLTFTQQDLEEVARKARNYSIDYNKLASSSLLELAEDRTFCTKDVIMEIAKYPRLQK